MTMEISEIGIRMRVRDGTGGSDVTQAQSDSGGGTEHDGLSCDQEEIVQACVRRVLHALKIMRER
jgi:Family of unknown function (DUF5908)